MTDEVPLASETQGQDSTKRARTWCFTWNNPPGVSENALEKAFDEGDYRYLVAQLEVGKSGTPHWQGYVEWKRPMRFNALKKLWPLVHWEARKGTRDEARAYCMKEDSRATTVHNTVAGPHELGKWIGGQGSRSDLAAVMDRVRAGATMRELCEEFPAAALRYSSGLQKARLIFASDERLSEPQVTLLYGPPGCGKTRMVYDEFKQDLWVNPLGAGGWYDGYDQHENALFDDFAGKLSGHRLTDVLRLLDRYTLRVATKGSFTVWVPKRLFLTSNYHPRRWWDWAGVGDGSVSREAQYPALARRFTCVVAWNSDGTDSRTIRRPVGWTRVRRDGSGVFLTDWDQFWGWEPFDGDEFDILFE